MSSAVASNMSGSWPASVSSMPPSLDGYEQKVAGGYDAELLEGLPVALVEQYAEVAARHAVHAGSDDGRVFVHVVGLDGAWGEGVTEAEAHTDLVEAIIGWVAVKRKIAAQIPRIEGIDLNRRSGE